MRETIFGIALVAVFLVGGTAILSNNNHPESTLNFTEAPSSRWVNNSDTITDEDLPAYKALSEESLEESNIYVFITDAFGDRNLWLENHQHILEDSKVILYDNDKTHILWDNNEQRFYKLPLSMADLAELSPVGVINQYVKYDAENGLIGDNDDDDDIPALYTAIITISIVMFTILVIAEILKQDFNVKVSHAPFIKKRYRSFSERLRRHLRTEDNEDFSYYLREIYDWVKEQNQETRALPRPLRELLTREAYSDTLKYALQINHEIAQEFKEKYPNKKDTEFKSGLMEVALQLSFTSHTLDRIETIIAGLPYTKADLSIPRYMDIRDRHAQSISEYKRYESKYLKEKGSSALSITKWNMQPARISTLVSEVGAVSMTADDLLKAVTHFSEA